MKTWMAVLALSGAMSMQSAVVSAGLFDGVSSIAQFSSQYPGYGGGRGGNSGYDRRQGHDPRNAQPAPQPPRERPRGQMTEEERRQLHRDLDKANRELYSGNRRRSVPAD